MTSGLCLGNNLEDFYERVVKTVMLGGGDANVAGGTKDERRRLLEETNSTVVV